MIPRILTLTNYEKKKQRGQKRKLKSLFKHIDQFKAYKNTTEMYEQFRVPCSLEFIESKKTKHEIKNTFFRKWIETTERFIKQKPSELLFCKVVSLISVPHYWDSRIIIFYDEDYYNNFWDRKTPEQLWERIEKKIFLLHVTETL